MNNNSKYPRGSEWRKWDLHIHSPESIIQDYGKDNWDKFIKTLESLPKEVKVIGLTDYYFLDGYEKIINYKLNKGRLQNIDKIFPILEFRIDTFASASENKFQKINLHILFDINEDNIKQEIEKVKKEFIEQIHITKLEKHKTKILSRENFIKCSSNGNIQSGFDDLIPNTDEVFGLLSLEPWKDKTLPFLGYKEWNNLDKGKQLKIFKDDLCNKVKIFLSATKLDTIEKKNEILKDYGNKILLLSNDIHSFKEFEEYECHTWIKADPTFEGLKQILYEPERAYIGEEPPKRKYVEQNKEYFIDSLKILSDKDEGEWFDHMKGDIVFNPGLVSIIGNKGNGKSALSDIIGILSDARIKKEDLSFLRSDKFLKLSCRDKYTGTISFISGSSKEKPVTAISIDESNPAKAIYLTQHFVENICEDLKASLLQDQIDQVIFSHLPEERKFGYDNLKLLRDDETKNIYQKLENEIKKLSIINKAIADYEFMSSPEEIKKIENLIKDKKELLSKTKNNKPDVVKKPKNLTTTKQTKLIEKNIVIAKKDNEATQKDLNKIIRERKDLKDIIEKFKTIEEEIKELIETSEDLEVVKKNKLDLKQIFKFTFDYKKITSVIDTLNGRIKEFDTIKKNKTEELKKLENQFTDLSKTFSIKEQSYQQYLNRKKTWQDKIKSIEGTTEKPDTLKYLEEKYNYIKNLLAKDLVQKREQRKEKTQRIIEHIFEMKNISPSIYKNAQLYADKRAEEFKIKDDFIEFTSQINLQQNFVDNFYNAISRKFIGTYYNDSNKESLRETIRNADLQTKEGLFRFSELLEDTIRKDYREEIEKRKDKDYVTIINQVRDKDLAAFYDFIYSFGYIDTRFDITYGGKKISELSPGERGTLLLIFYLLIDQDKKPIIIDQPEENLDNETVFRKLVPFIKKIKEERQIIIVTHNPNLAIVCDSEQIIHAHIDKKNNNLVSYNSGSIEHYNIREKAMDILEGTEKAFTNRKNKYHII